MKDRVFSDDNAQTPKSAKIGSGQLFEVESQLMIWTMAGMYRKQIPSWAEPLLPGEADDGPSFPIPFPVPTPQCII